MSSSLLLSLIFKVASYFLTIKISLKFSPETDYTAAVLMDLGTYDCAFACTCDMQLHVYACTLQLLCSLCPLLLFTVLLAS